MSDKILVGIRVRPLINREVQDASNLHWGVKDNTITNVDPISKKPLSTATPYKFDRVFGDNYNNDDIYMEVGEPIVESALAGFNGTIFAYGQTSSGKTFTMMGDKNTPGVIPLAISHIFQYIENTPDREFLIRASFMEIYNENITDLLATGLARTKNLSVREEASGQVYVADLTEELCNNEELLYSLMDKGNKNRTVGQTNMNDRSSRSHTIFRIILESRERSDTDHTEEAVTVSHLNLVDLAGSENASQTGATGQRLKEGGFINSSLFMLGRVISQLSDGDPYVNFRDSKLTRILQSSLGGNAKTVIICTVTPASVELKFCQIKFASRAKSIKNNAVVNEVLSDAALLKRYAKEIAALKKKLENERKTDKAQEVEQVKEKLDEEARQKQELISKNQELITKINNLKEVLVVSSHLPNKEVDKRKKLRRETWAAPAQRRAMRMSCAAPLKLEPFFLKPELPPWNSLMKDLPASLDGSGLNASSVSMGFGQDDPDNLFDMAEESILARHEEDDTFNPYPEVAPITKRTRRVKFDMGTPPKTFSSVECQTEETLLKSNLSLCTTPSRSFGTPFSAAGTPRVVLRERYHKLQDELEEKDEWLSEWKNEHEDMSEFHKLELQMREESFMGKLEMGPIDEEKVEELNKEIRFLKQSMKDSEGLLLDSNKALSERNQDVVMLQNQLDDLRKDHIAADSLKEELDSLKIENNSFIKDMEQQKQQLTKLQNERQDFDMMMELALEKQKLVEKDLRRSLDDAWDEIANLEGGNKDAVRGRIEKITSMEAELQSLREFSGKDMEIKLNEMKSRLEETESKYQNALKDRHTQDEKLEQLQKLVSCMAVLEAKVGKIENLETQVLKSFEESKDLKTTINSLQTELDHRALLEPTEEGSPEAYQNKITELQEEVDYLRMKFDESSCFAVPRPVGLATLSPCPPRLLSASSRSNLSIVAPSDLSRKLSETIHALEESLLSPITPTQHSVSSMDDHFLDPQEINTIKEQLIALQNALMSQEYDLQLQTEAYKYEQEYHNQVILNAETENLLWTMQDFFNAEYLKFYTEYINKKTDELKAMEVSINETFETSLKITAYNDLKEEVDNSQTDQELELQLADNEIERKKLDVNLGNKSRKSVAPVSLAEELKVMEMSVNETFESSVVNLGSNINEEIKELREKLQILENENQELKDKIND
ncbi:unnamed protein product, partial [Meganyctiphanes norvegica]